MGEQVYKFSLSTFCCVANLYRFLIYKAHFRRIQIMYNLLSSIVPKQFSPMISRFLLRNCTSNLSIINNAIRIRQSLMIDFIIMKLSLGRSRRLLAYFGNGPCAGTRCSTRPITNKKLIGQNDYRILLFEIQ